MSRILSVLLLALAAQIANAAEPTQVTLERFLNSYQFEPIREAWAFRLDREIKGELERLRSTPGISPETRSAITKYEAAASAELRKQMTSENLRPRYAAIFKKVYSEAEMQEITRFYESEAGKASVQKRAQVAALIQEQFIGLSQELSASLASARKEVQDSASKPQGK